mmetsp:Transcript_86725/g.269621  ORF Transcript_86725/g.269621 Transcript_86725/m.269621 type:complete len:108 (+) Transcript_86725:468-791(+)
MVPASYPAPPLNQLAGNVVGTMQILLIGLLFMVNDKMLPEGIRENKMATVMAIFFMSSMLASAFTKTNAFEIYVGRKLVFSKLQAGRMPNMRDLIKGFKAVGVTVST